MELEMVIPPPLQDVIEGLLELIETEQPASITGLIQARVSQKVQNKLGLSTKYFERKFKSLRWVHLNEFKTQTVLSEEGKRVLEELKKGNYKEIIENFQNCEPRA